MNKTISKADLANGKANGQEIIIETRDNLMACDVVSTDGNNLTVTHAGTVMTVSIADIVEARTF